MSEPPVIRISLTMGYEALVDEIDADLASLKWRAQRAAKSRTVYAATASVKGSPIILIHRIVAERLLGRPLVGKELVDHIDGNGLNNIRANLRLATHAENMRNRRLHSNNTSGYRGVYWDAHYRKWRAALKVNGKIKSLGSFRDILDAVRAYNAAAILYYGEFAVINEITE